MTINIPAPPLKSGESLVVNAEKEGGKKPSPTAKVVGGEKMKGVHVEGADDWEKLFLGKNGGKNGERTGQSKVRKGGSSSRAGIMPALRLIDVTLSSQNRKPVPLPRRQRYGFSVLGRITSIYIVRSFQGRGVRVVGEVFKKTLVCSVKI